MSVMVENEQRESLRNQATEYKIQAWRLYFGQVGHRYEAEAVKWLVAAGNVSNVNMRQTLRTKTKKIETNQEGNYECKN